MKKLNNIFLALLALVVVACGDPDLPFDTFEDLEKGAYARRLSVSGAFTFGQVANSNFQVEVEFYSEDQGANVASYDWTVEYSGVAGDIVARDFISVPSSSFGTSANGLPGTTVTFEMSQALTVLGLGEADITGGDRFRFLGTVVLNDGRRFGDANTGVNLKSSASFAAMTRLDANVVCVSDLGGTMNYSNTNMFRGAGNGGQGAACAIDPITGSFEIRDDGDGNYTFIDGNGNNDQSFGMFDSCWSDDPQMGDRGMTDVCGLIDNRGTDKYGDTYYWSNLTGAGTNAISFDWINDWGDRGRVTLTRTDGNNWPPETRVENN